ncbi:MAG: DUF3764 family protein, partial [Bacteroidia bacterium]
VLIIATTFAFTTFKNGPVIMMITIEVKNFEEWKKGFDAGAPVREKAGIKVLSICTDIDNPNNITVIEEAENAQAANDFLTMLKSKQKQLDVKMIDVKTYDKVN